jgi:hypothetical protein
MIIGWGKNVIPPFLHPYIYSEGVFYFLAPVSFIGISIVSALLIDEFKCRRLRLRGTVVMLLSNYVTIIIAFGQIYDFISHQGQRDAFNLKLDAGLSLYFSTTTMATVGFGDIYPKSGLARAVVCLQIIVGVFYNVGIFAMFASYMTAHLVNKKERNQDGVLPMYVEGAAK